MDLNLDVITDWFNNIKLWFEENKEWMLIPAIVTTVTLILGLILMLLTGKGINFFVKVIFILLFLSSPVIGYFIGEFVDPYLEPLLSKILQK
jgi:hypothetical protein